MKKALVLGTGMPQGDLIKEFKSRGTEVHACSYKAGYAAEKFADHFELINIVDIDAVEAYAKKIGADFVYSAGSDVAMPTAFTVSERLGLPCFCSSEAALVCNRKPLLRSGLGNSFEGNIKYQKAFSADDAITVPFPLMMKPTDSQGQRGVCRVDSLREFRENFERSASFCRMPRFRCGKARQNRIAACPVSASVRGSGWPRPAYSATVPSSTNRPSASTTIRRSAGISSRTFATPPAGT